MKLSQNTILERFKEVHGDKYIYSKVKYVNIETPIIIICPVHGEFQQCPSVHMRGGDCPLCSRLHQLQVKKDNYSKKFFQESSIVHHNKYSYSKAVYTKMNDLITITCPVHGEFQQKAYNHLKGSGCPKCKGKNLTLDDLINRFKEVHGDKYIYSKVELKGFHEKITIICPTHGEFQQSIDSHSRGGGCPLCRYKEASLRNRSDASDVIKKFKEVHGDKYDYSKVRYINGSTKVTIICPVHGEFQQIPLSHKNGNGCPRCQDSHGERIIHNYLENTGLDFITQKTFKDCRYKQPLRFDFYIPSLNTCIEFDGPQHFKSIPRYGGDKAFLITKLRDSIKNIYCNKNNIKLIRIPYNKMKDIPDILERSLYGK